MNARTPIDLDAALRDLAASLDVPAAPDYAALVLPLIAAPPARRAAALGPRRTSRLLLAAALVLLSALATTLAIPASRHALTSWFGFSGIELRTAPSTATLPTAPPGPPSPTALGAGPRSTLRAAQTAAGGRVALPARLPRPTMVFEYEQEGATVVTLAYRHAPGLTPTPDTGFALLVTEVFDAGRPILAKLLYFGSSAVRVDVHGAAGVYVRGPQEIMNEERSRTDHGMQVVHEVAPRASANTLIWSVGPATYRLEADFTRSAALDIARGLG